MQGDRALRRPRGGALAGRLVPVAAAVPAAPVARPSLCLWATASPAHPLHKHLMTTVHHQRGDSTTYRDSQRQGTPPSPTTSQSGTTRVVQLPPARQCRPHPLCAPHTPALQSTKGPPACCTQAGASPRAPYCMGKQVCWGGRGGCAGWAHALARPQALQVAGRSGRGPRSAGDKPGRWLPRGHARGPAAGGKRVAEGGALWLRRSFLGAAPPAIVR